MEIGEGTASYTESPAQDEEKQHVKVRFSVFFDGTLNNRTNIDHRLANTEIYRQYENVASYEGDYTNVAKMERYVTDAKGYQVTLSTYVEGPGTVDEEKDRMRGYAFGTGSSGVREKVRKGLLDVVKRIFKHVNDQEIIKELTLDVFGFSRGAAGARNFIYEALLGQTPLKDLLEDNGRQVTKIKVCFAGLYDTVSSHGIFYFNDVRDLKLHAVSHAQAVVQLAAADEHRKNFSLTTIDSANGNGREIYLPGVHSDIGGGYNNNITEKQIIFRGGEFDKSRAEKERSELIAAGWYKEHEIAVEEVVYPEGTSDILIAVLKKGLKNHYSRIPLLLMARFASESNIKFFGDLYRDTHIPNALSIAKSEIDSYVNDSLGPSKASDWGHNSDWLRVLRHKYFHFSSRMEVGHGPRYINGERRRKRYYG